MPLSTYKNLPKSVLSHIDKLERDVDFWKQRATAGPEESDTFVGYVDQDRPLGKGVTVKFYPDTNRRTTDYIHVENEGDGCVVITSSWRGISVEPLASNSIRVRVRG